MRLAVPREAALQSYAYKGPHFSIEILGSSFYELVHDVKSERLFSRYTESLRYRSDS